MENNSGLTLSLCKAFDILACFTAETPQLRVIDLTKRLKMTQSNISRLLGTMAAYGYVEKDESTGCYQLGSSIITMSSIALNSIELRKQALPELFALEQKYGISANLAILKNNSMYYLAHVDSRSAPRMYTMVGYTNPLHCTAIGKVLLAFMPENDRKQIIAETGLPAYTHNTITDEEKLLAELEEVRRKGYSKEWGEHAIASSCVAAPIRDRTSKVIAGLSVSGKYNQCNLMDKEKEAAQIVIEAANIISNKLGCF
jgi:DNA-binding IclR family transcriptional regulator